MAEVQKCHFLWLT